MSNTLLLLSPSCTVSWTRQQALEHELRCREEARPSVFDRLTNGSDHRADGGRTKMRMDSVPATLLDTSTPSYQDTEPSATPSVFVVRAFYYMHRGELKMEIKQESHHYTCGSPNVTAMSLLS